MKENKKNKIGTIRKKGNKYEGRIYVTDNGKRVQKSVYGATERETEDKMKALRRYYEEKNSNTEEIAINISVEDWIKVWVKDYKRPLVAQSTINGYIEKIKAYIIPAFGNLKVVDVQKRDIQLMINGLIARNLSHKTRKDTLGICRMIFQSAIDDVPLREYNPAIGVKLGQKDPPKEKKIMSAEEQLEVMKILMTEYNGIVFFTFFCLGVRASELSGFLWKDLDNILENITVDRGFQVLDVYDDNLERVGIERKYTELKSYYSHRKIPIIPILKEELLKYKMHIMKALNIEDEKLLDNESMFRTKVGNVSADYLRHRLNNILKKHNLNKVTVHELRHTFATRCLESGIDMKTLQLLLGHADYSTTANIYVHILKDRKNKELQKYNTYMNNVLANELNTAKASKNTDNIAIKEKQVVVNAKLKVKPKKLVKTHKKMIKIA